MVVAFRGWRFVGHRIGKVAVCNVCGILCHCLILCCIFIGPLFVTGKRDIGAGLEELLPKLVSHISHGRMDLFRVTNLCTLPNISRMFRILFD
jgi:hypothetical protein